MPIKVPFVQFKGIWKQGIKKSESVPICFWRGNNQRPFVDRLNIDLKSRRIIEQKSRNPGRQGIKEGMSRWNESRGSDGTKKWKNWKGREKAGCPPETADIQNLEILANDEGSWVGFNYCWGSKVPRKFLKKFSVQYSFHSKFKTRYSPNPRAIWTFVETNIPLN
jgi:hypothetical protein